MPFFRFLFVVFFIAQAAIAQKDSINISLQDAGEISIKVSAEEFKKLKEIDLNKVINEVNLPSKENSSVDYTFNREFIEKEFEKDSSSEESSFDWPSTIESWGNNSFEGTKFNKNRNFYVDLGMNNYFESGALPNDNNRPYALKTWGLNYISFSSAVQNQLGKSLFVEGALSLSWNNLKFENSATQIYKTDSTITFAPNISPNISPIKSKLVVSYLTASFLPFLEYASSSNSSSKRRFGLGVYGGIRLWTYTKTVFREDGDKKKNRERDDYDINSLRYGIRGLMGFNRINFFFNYDLSPLFNTEKGPDLNLISFGISI